jgi:hypothetical protein
MKETDSLENQLLSLRPRRPSPGLKRKLFAAPSVATRRVAWVLGSLAPATACALLTLAVFNPGNYGDSSHPAPMMAMILSNQSSAAYASGNGGQSQNSLFSVTFDWTNQGVLTSSMPSFSRTR